MKRSPAEATSQMRQQVKKGQQGTQQAKPKVMQHAS
jgi:hypothetical protein